MVIIILLQVINITVGKVFEDDCKSEPNIPAWLITFSIGMLVLIIDIIAMYWFNLRRNLFIGGLLGGFLVVWHIKGKFCFIKFI